WAKGSAAGAAPAAACTAATSTTSAAGSASGAAATCLGACPANGSENELIVVTGTAGAARSASAPSFEACLRSDTTSSHAPVAITSNSNDEESSTPLAPPSAYTSAATLSLSTRGSIRICSLAGALNRCTKCPPISA